MKQHIPLIFFGIALGVLISKGIRMIPTDKDVPEYDKIHISCPLLKFDERLDYDEVSKSGDVIAVKYKVGGSKSMLPREQCELFLYKSK